MGGYREYRDRLFSKAHGDRMRTNRQKLQHGKFQLVTRSTVFTNAPNTGTGTLTGGEISFLGGMQNLTGQTLASSSKLVLLGVLGKKLPKVPSNLNCAVF